MKKITLTKKNKACASCRKRFGSGFKPASLVAILCPNYKTPSVYCYRICRICALAATFGAEVKNAVTVSVAAYHRNKEAKQ